MKGWQIFVHSVRLIVNNLGDALRVSALLYLVQVAHQIYAFAYLPARPTGGEGLSPEEIGASGQGGMALLLFLAFIVSSLWIAVGWHRFVLEEEYPRGWIPQWHGGAMLSYLWRSILVFLAVGALMFVALFVIAMVALVSPALIAVFGLGIVGLGSYLFFRLGVTLPATAVGHKLSLRESWKATRDRDGAIVILAFITIAATALIQLPNFAGEPRSLLTLVYTLVTGWIATMVGISVLTTLYGHYVQGRPID
ncbi:hypothetical protein [Allosediminivita pacifica]|uniref:Uncharacterized protein n=1 Tax=Allosediminivita pacifica TaxID=1267769 RepID=A0A2T6B5V6_9RHOB|nr:hypothetical protein [Allosediminivita pacifica]PTX51435.1 hypothetical protein C8N44_103179 [Allosediminivita pacifica]GGA99816.1 hypothetical protein GCM10011324_07560 [Allosediminivita pacifica]